MSKVQVPQIYSSVGTTQTDQHRPPCDTPLWTCVWSVVDMNHKRAAAAGYCDAARLIILPAPAENGQRVAGRLMNLLDISPWGLDRTENEYTSFGARVPVSWGPGGGRPCVSCRPRWSGPPTDLTSHKTRANVIHRSLPGGSMTSVSP